MKYEVRIPYVVWQVISIDDADSEEDAEQQAFDEAGLTTFAGNGGTDKLIGVYGNNRVECGDEPLEMGECKVEVEKVDE